MTAVYMAVEPRTDMTEPLIACNHCGLIALNTPAFGWKRYLDEDGKWAHHCPAAIEYNSWIAQGLVHLKAPDEAIIYEDPDRWIEELLGALPKGTMGPQDD
jgi:hypothetical protein